jgi:hypothetical protein
VPLDVVVSQRPHDEKPAKKVVRTQVECSAWDHQLFLNPHALKFYLKFVLACGITLTRFEECQCEDDDVRFHYQIWIFGDDHYCWFKGTINPFPMEH